MNTTLDRITRHTAALGGLTQSTYDSRGNLTAVIDANAHAIETNAYDLMNRLTQRTDATNKASTSQYDALRPP